MFLRAGALSLALLLASRLLGVVRESAQAAAFGSSGLADVAVLLLTLPDWLASVVASGALAYVLLPAWAGQGPAAVAAVQRRVALGACAAAAVLGLALIAGREPALRWLAGGLPPGLQPLAVRGLVWSALAVPLALLAAVWATRAQHERDFAGLYGANLVVNAVLIATIVAAGHAAGVGAVTALGLGLLAAMLGRLLWLRVRLPRALGEQNAAPVALPAPPVWMWAALSAGLPLALPFVARSVASQAGAGALASFNYAWKLVELPLVLAIQLVAALAFPAIARALAAGAPAEAARAPVRQAFALAWTLACAAVAGLQLGGPALAQLLFGWGRMQAGALDQVARWGMAGAWGLLPQALTAVALTVLASRRRMHPVVLAYALALAAVLAVAAAGWHDGLRLMLLLNAGQAGVALVCLWALGAERQGWLPWSTFFWALLGLALALAAGALVQARLPLAGMLPGLAAGALAALLVIALAAGRSTDLRHALRR